MFQLEESDEIFDVVIRYGLYLVAVFQLVCITTVFLLTDQSNDSKVCSIYIGTNKIPILKFDYLVSLNNTTIKELYTVTKKDNPLLSQHN